MHASQDQRGEANIVTIEVMPTLELDDLQPLGRRQACRFRDPGALARPRSRYRVSFSKRP
jgi:hypothetical protein